MAREASRGRSVALWEVGGPGGSMGWPGSSLGRDPSSSPAVTLKPGSSCFLLPAGPATPPLRLCSLVCPRPSFPTMYP